MKFLIPHFLVVACTSASDDVDVDETTTPPTTTKNPTGPTTDPDPWFCTEATPTVTPNGLYQDVETEHYRMSLAVTPERAEELGRFAEAAYAAMADRFGAEPTDLPLEVNLYPDVAAFEAAIRADGLTPPSGAGGYYHPSSKTAYVLAAPTQYYEDTILLHEMLHQFHYLSRTGNVNVPTWYAEGLAEAWSRHDWDLECLRLGRIPLLTQEDAYDQALDELSGGLALSSILTESEVPSRPVGMAVFQHLDRTYPEDFASFRAAMDDHTADPLGEFEALFGDADLVAEDVTTWIADNQEPMIPVYLEWIHRTPQTVSSIFVNGVSSLARVKEPPATFEVDVHPGSGAWTGGILLSWDGYDAYAAAYASSDGSVSIFEVIGGDVSWFDIGTAPDPVDGKLSWTLTHSGGEAAFEINGEAFAHPIQQSPSAGLSVYDSDLLFELR